MVKPERQKHNYTNEFELKSLLIRVKNSGLKGASTRTEKYNNLVNKYIKLLDKLSKKKYKTPEEQIKKTRIRKELKKRIIYFSEITNIDKKSYDRFGEIILLMIKKILTMPKFSGYTYKDEFYSDSCHKILKYLHNFDHTLVSQISGQSVSSFAYISQIIHNSIKFIINTKNKQQKLLNQQIAMEDLNHSYGVKSEDNNISRYNPDEYKDTTEETIEIKKLKTSLYDYIISLEEKLKKHDYVTIIYPGDYRISMDEYKLLQPLLKNKLSITRKRPNVTISETE